MLIKDVTVRTLKFMDGYHPTENEIEILNLVNYKRGFLSTKEINKISDFEIKKDVSVMYYKNEAIVSSKETGIVCSLLSNIELSNSIADIELPFEEGEYIENLDNFKNEKDIECLFGEFLSTNNKGYIKMKNMVGNREYGEMLSVTFDLNKTKEDQPEPEDQLAKILKSMETGYLGLLISKEIGFSDSLRNDILNNRIKFIIK